MRRRIVVSRQILAEVESVLLRTRIRRRYKFKTGDISEYCSELTRISTVLAPEAKVRASRDPKDDMVLDCAVAAAAQIYCDPGRCLLSLRHFEEIEIVTPETLVANFRQQKA